jgi:ribonuclease R
MGAERSVPLSETVLELLASARRPMAVREIAQKLSLRGEERRALKSTLRDLLGEGTLVKIRGARVGIPQRMSLVVGTLSCRPGGYGFVVPDAGAPRQAARAEREQQVFVPAVHLKEAVHGDRVVARVERHSEKGREGRIIRILERSLPRVVGRYEEDPGGVGGYVVPFDRRILHELYVPVGGAGEARPGEMVTAVMTRPPSAKRNPQGRVVEVLGRADEPGVDVRVILAKHELSASFPADVEAQAESIPPAVRPRDIEGRRDFRDWPTITIDPADARDHDDAISLARRDDGWQLAVHIADVAHYVREGDPIDEEAYRRGTSVYFPGLVVPMIPHALSSGICSLVAGDDRLTQTVVMDVDAQGHVLSAQVHDGVIRCAAGLSYQAAQAILDGDAGSAAQDPSVARLVADMAALARVMRERRFARGSLDLDLPEPRIELDQNGEMIGITAAERLETMRVIEELMLAANEAVASILVDAEAPTLYRVHERPDPERIEEFCELAASLGLEVPSTNVDVRPEHFQEILRQIEGRPAEKLLSYLLLRTMKLARYDEDNLGHFGLAAERYLHFTSPIRRYPDLVVHRAVRALRHGSQQSLDEERRERLAAMGAHLSERERQAEEAERELIEWKKVRFMSRRVGETFHGYVTGAQAFGLFVELEDIFVQGLVHVSSMADDYYSFDERAHALLGAHTARRYRLGDRVEVQVLRVDLDRRFVDFGLVDVIERTASRHGGAADSVGPSGKRGRGGRRPGRSRLRD